MTSRAASRRSTILAELGIERWRLRAVPESQAGADSPGAAAATERRASELASRAALPETAAPEPAVAAGVAAPWSADSGRANWPALNERIRACTRCDLHATRTQAVCGVGSETADWLIVGEAPGAEEDARGEPFVGRAGRLLDEMLLAVGLQRETVYIANVLKCRPPDNRNPAPDEVAQCRPHLEQQIEWLQPRIILAVGAFAARTLLNADPATPVGKLRGEVHRYGPAQIPLVVTYHPAYLLRRPLEKRRSWSDLLLARDQLDAASARVS